MIKLNKITHYYGDKPILKNLVLDVPANILSCILGGSGSGKTTILRLISGLEIPHSGEISINNNLVTKNKKILIPPNRRDIGFIFQDLALWPHFTVFQNIAFGLEERKEEHIYETVKNILDFFNLYEHKDKYPNQLSGGQQQLVAISRSLVLKPKILLMDEPLANLDVKLKRKILDYIKKIKNEFDLTIVYVTHDHKEAFAIADNVIVMNEGNIEETGNVNQIKNSDNKYIKYFIEY